MNRLVPKRKVESEVKQEFPIVPRCFVSLLNVLRKLAIWNENIKKALIGDEGVDEG